MSKKNKLWTWRQKGNNEDARSAVFHTKKEAIEDAGSSKGVIEVLHVHEVKPADFLPDLVRLLEDMTENSWKEFETIDNDDLGVFSFIDEKRAKKALQRWAQKHIRVDCSTHYDGKVVGEVNTGTPRAESNADVQLRKRLDVDLRRFHGRAISESLLTQIENQVIQTLKKVNPWTS